jgi:hypothetical protein
MRALISITAAICALLATVAMTASAAGNRQLDIPACEELLTVRQARAAMREPKTLLVDRRVEGGVRVCYYAASQKRSYGHVIAVNWGPYAEFRKWFGKGDLTEATCDVDADACQALKRAAKQRSEVQSFAGLLKALDQVGNTNRRRALAFKGSPPAFVWIPSHALTPLDLSAWVLAYDVKSAHLLVVSCTDNADRAPDAPCAIAAAKRVLENIT